MAEKQNTPQSQNTTNIDTDIFVKGMTKDPNASLVGKDQWTHARNAINNSKDGDIGTLGNEPGNKLCTSAPFTIIGTTHLYGDKWILFSTNNQQSEIGTWDDSECKYETIVNDFSCYICSDQNTNSGVGTPSPTTNTESKPCLNFSTQYLITGAAKENFDCSWQVYWDDGLNPSRTLNLDNIPWHRRVISAQGADCVVYEDIEPLCLDCEKIRLAPLVNIPCIDISKSKDGGQLRNGSYQVFIAYAVNDQIVGDYYGISNIQPLFDHEDLLSGLEINITNLDKRFDFFQLVICSFNQGEQQAKELGFYTTEQSVINIDYINQKLKAVPLSMLPITTPAYEKSDDMYVVNDYLVRSSPTEQFDFNYQPLANNIHAHWTVTQFPSDYYKKGGNKATFMRDEVYSFFIRFVYNTGEKSSSYHIPGRAPYNWNGITDSSGTNPNVLDPWPGNNDLGTASWVANGSVGTQTADRLFEVHNTADDGWWVNPVQQTNDGGTVIREGHCGYWESTERYPQDPVRYGNLCGSPIRHHKMPDETTAWTELVSTPGSSISPNNYLDRSSNDNENINILGVRFQNIAWPRFNGSTGDPCTPSNGAPEGDLIPNIVGYEILVGSREGNKSIIAKGISRNMRQYVIPPSAQGHEVETGSLTGYIPNYPFNDCQADPYLSNDSGFSYTRSGWGGSDQTNDTASPPEMTSTNLYTFHSPETSFNKPFLSPYELKSYGICSGTALGRFKPSEKHPQHKLLRNISMWIGIIVGVGYAISEMRGKRMKTQELPKALSVGLSQNPRSGGAVGTEDYAIVNSLTTGFGLITHTNDGGLRAAAPANSVMPNPMLQTSGMTNMMASYNLSNAPIPIPGISGAMSLAQTGLTTATVLGAPKIGMNIYEPATRTAMGQWGNNRGFIGAGESISYEGSRFESLPAVTQLLFGVYNFMAFTATGGQEIIDLIYNLVSYQDYAWKYGSQGLYFSTNQIQSGDVFRQIIDKGRYIGSSMQNLNANIRINNLQRPKTVVISTVTNGADFPIATGPIEDNSKLIIGSFDGWFKPSEYRDTNIAAHYTALKVAFKNQYGQLDQIKQIPAGCITYFKDQQKTNNQGDPVPATVDDLYTTSTVYGGDCYLNRYSEKVIMPFFWDFMKEQPDGFPYDYKLRSNVPRPIYWMDTKKYELSEMVRQIVTFSFLVGGNTQGLTSAMPSGLYFLDRPNADFVDDDGGDSSPNPQGSSGPDNTTAPQQVAPQEDNQGRSLFHIKNGYMYTHCNGINEFFVESTINTALRDWEDVDDKRHYDQLEYTDVEALFDADIIRKDNFYKYDSSLSKGRFTTQLISYGFMQPRDYDPIVAEKCYVYYPKRLIYSLQAQKEAKKDFWKVFLPLNYKDFKNKVNVIKPASKSGAIILFPNLSPTMWQGVDQLQTELGTKLTIGDGGLFSQPQQNIVNADLPFEYGSCESARSIVNTPSGLFYISQAQGKIFHYTGQGLVNIANKGMKQWFNKYLPSFLLKQYPEMEDCSNWVDNPVAGIGCQSVYDPNYDLIYFCKKDYKCTMPEYIDYVPCEGFVYNNTTSNNVPPVPCCPDGYSYIPSSTTCPAGYSPVSCLNGDPCCTNNAGSVIPATVTESECCLTTIVPANIDQQAGKVDIVFTVDSSNSIENNDNTGNMQNFIRTMTNQLATELGNGSVRIGLTHFGGGRCTDNALFNGQTCDCDECTHPDEMFEITNQVTLTSNKTTINNWIGNPGAWNGSEYPPDCSSIYGTATCTVGKDYPWGTDILAGLWTGLNLLYGLGSRQVPKVLITLFDGPQYTNTNNPVDPIFYTSTPYTGPNGIFGNDVYNQMTVNPVTADISYAQQTNNWTLNEVEAKWFTNNVLNNAAYNATPYIQKSYSVVVDPDNAAPTAGHILYAEQFATSAGNTYGGSFSDQSQIEAIANEIIQAVTPPPIYSCDDPNCILIVNNAGQHMCECTDCLPVTMLDNTTPIDFGDPTYFEEISWTVSYDPKYEAWISFHDWHPDLTIPSLNHFFTTNTYEDLETTPSCPPGFTWNPSTQTCCQTFQGEYEADIIVDEVPVEFDQESIPCKLDIVIACDASWSMNTIFAGNTTNNWTQAKIFIDEFVFAMSSEMIAGNTQIGLTNWSLTSGQRLDTPDAIANGTPPGGCCTFTGVVNTGEVSMTNNPMYDSYTTPTSSNFQLLTNPIGGGSTQMQAGYNHAQQVLWDVGKSALGDRTLDVGYKRILIFIADGGDNSGATAANTGSYHNPTPGGGPINPNTATNGYSGSVTNAGVSGQMVESRNITVYASNGGNNPAAGTAGFNAIANTTNYGSIDQFNADTNTSSATAQNCPSCVAGFITAGLCTLPPVCTCPAGYERISTVGTSTAPPYTVLGPNDNCESEGRAGICRKMTCECDPSKLPNPVIPITQTGQCPTDILNGIAKWYNQNTGVGDSTWENPMPLTCHYNYECCIDGITQRGGIWKHNDRCDLYVNYYDHDHPWEIEWVESVGQAVNTIRSIEYQLESYIYKGNLDDNCGDRFHDLDWNFDDAIIHNTEQVSGLLVFNLTPKNDVPLITQFPQITGNDIQILYSKEEQKYRFNQFWDITRDRGEFDPNENSSIFITQLNGYIRDLNQANLNYFKPAFQRKKFRHYWNKVILRKNISANRKMIFKLANTKINASFR